MNTLNITIFPYFYSNFTFDLPMLCGALIVHSPNNFQIAPLVDGLIICSTII